MKKVTIANLVRAETDHMIRAQIEAFNLKVGQITHLRDPITPENQLVIRSNQDTIYSATALDLSEPVTITLPEADGRFMSMLVVNQDHYIFGEAQPGAYELTEENVGTRFAWLLFRTFVDVTDPNDIAAAHAAQDAIGISGGGDGPFEAPDWDTTALEKARKAVSTLSELGFNASHAFGRKGEVDPVDHLVGALAGWGGQPPSMAVYEILSVEQNDGQTPHAVTVKDVPVDAFWSLTVYNAQGYLEANDLGLNSYNNFTAQPNEDGSYTIHFGGCDDGRINCLPIMPGWNYLVRLYQPREEILDGSWQFPAPQPVD
jgi:hypothetical protein